MIQIEEVDITLLKDNEYNPKKLSVLEEEELRKSIEKFGIVDPLIVNKNPERKNILIGGHQRLRVLKQLGYKKVPVVYIDIADKEKERELCLRLSKNTGSFDWQKLLSEFSEDFLKSVGFTKAELKRMEEAVYNIKNDIDKFLAQEKLPDLLPQEEFENNEELRDIGEESKKGYVMNDYLINFPSSNKYEIPDLLPEKIFSQPLDGDISTFITRKGYEELEKPQVVLYKHRHQVKKSENKIISFFLYDYIFDRIWQEAYEKTLELTKRKWLAVMSPDFSIAEADPIALQIYQVFKTRYMDRYFQEFGLNVIPLLQFISCSARAYDYSFAGIPYGCPTIGIQLHTFKERSLTKEYKEKIMFQLYYAQERINPEQVLVYGTHFLVEELKQIFKKVIFIPTFSDIAFTKLKKERFLDSNSSERR